MIVYHGSTTVVKSPDVRHSFRPLDFGKGFYITTNMEQAKNWARRKADLNENDKAYVNVYDMREKYGDLNVKTFPPDLLEWIDFVCRCRDGGDEYQAFDVIRGMVANDKVFRVVDLYHSGVWDKERALIEIKAYPEYDQIAFITQRAIDALLTFKTVEEV